MAKEEIMKEIKKITKQQCEAIVKNYTANELCYETTIRRVRRLVEKNKTRKEEE